MPQMGSYMYGTEKVEWSYKNVVLVFTLWLKMKLAGPTKFRCDHLDILTSLDHGKGHSRITVTFIARWQIDNGEWNEDEYSYTIGNARCKKDNAEIFKNTFGPHLNNHLKEIRASACVSIIDGNPQLGVSDEAQKTVPVELWMAGDSLFYSLALGKEGYSTWWCSFCRLFKTSWQEAGHLPGEPWTLLGLKEHASKIENGETNVNNVQAVCGVREAPVFDAIDVDHYVIPSLHLLIGKGDDGLDNFFLEIQAAAESYTAEYHLAEKEVVQIAAELEGTRGDLAWAIQHHSS